MCNMRTIGPAVSEKKIFEIVDDGRTPEHGYTMPSAQVSQKCRGGVNAKHIIMGCEIFSKP